MLKFRYFIDIVREMAMVAFLLGLAVITILVALLISDSRYQIKGTMANIRDASWSFRSAAHKLNVLVGPLESRAAADQTIAHTVSSLNYGLEQGSERLREAKTLIPAAQHLIVTLDGTARQFTEVTLPGIDQQVGALGRPLRSLERTVRLTNDVLVDAKPLVVTSTALASQFLASAPLFLDCDHNPSCAFNLFQGTAKSIERISKAWSDRAPATAQAVQSTTQNVQSLSRPGWLTRLLKRVF